MGSIFSLARTEWISHRGSGDVLRRSLQQDSLTKTTRGKFWEETKTLTLKPTSTSSTSYFTPLLNTVTYFWVRLSYVLTWYFSSYELKQQLRAGATRHRAVHASLMVSHIQIAIFLSFEIFYTKLEDWPAGRLKSTQVTCHSQVKSSEVECDQVDGGRLGVDFSLKSGHVSVPQRLAGLDRGDASPQYSDWGGQYYECPPQYFKSNIGYFSSV